MGDTINTGPEDPCLIARQVKQFDELAQTYQ